jgi:hypothetical protein
VPFAQAIACVLVGERCDRDDRAEDLALDHLVVLLEVRDDVGSRKKPGRSGSVPPVTTSGVAGLALEEALDALALRGAS